MVVIRNNTEDNLLFLLKLDKTEKRAEVEGKTEVNVKTPYYPIIHLEIRKANGMVWSGYIPYSDKPIIYNGMNLSVGNLIPPSLHNYSPSSTTSGRWWVWILLLIVIILAVWLLFKKK